MNPIFELVIKMMFNMLPACLIVFCWEDCYSKKKSQWYIVVLIGVTMTIITAILNNYFPRNIRLPITLIAIVLINYLYLTKNIKKSFLLVAVSELVVWISEFSVVIITSLIYGERVYDVLYSLKGFIILNICISVLMFLILKSTLPKNLYNRLNKILRMSKYRETIVYVSSLILIIVITTIESFMQLPPYVIFATNIGMGLIFMLIVLKFAFFKTRYNTINSKYQNSISSLKEYETMIDKFRISNHENKNELLIIRNMSKNKDVIEYIDKLVDNKIKDNEEIMYKTSKIPEGGLRATIYSKLLLMDKYKIKYDLDISNDVKTSDLVNLNEDITLNACKILGVFLDNAIEAVEKMKNKIIKIEIYSMDDSLCIDMTNNYSGNLDLTKLGNRQYSTKGEGHGYGLALVNNIIKENSDILENERSVNGNNFTQSLKIKM